MQIVGCFVMVLFVGWGLSVGVGGSICFGDSGQVVFGWDICFDSLCFVEVSYSGNLIVCMNGVWVCILICIFIVDVCECGFGECMGENGMKYVL